MNRDGQASTLRANHGLLLRYEDNDEEDGEYLVSSSLFLDRSIRSVRVVESTNAASYSENFTVICHESHYVDSSKDISLGFHASSGKDIASIPGIPMQSYCALLVGLPCTVTEEALHSFVEPYAGDLMACKFYRIDAPILCENVLATRSSRVSSHVSSACGVVSFSSDAARNSFVMVYNNLRFPNSTQLTHSGAEGMSNSSPVSDEVEVPLLVIALAWIHVAMLPSKSHHSASADVIDTRALSYPAAICPKVQGAPDITSRLELPICSVCIRRLNPLYSGVPGAEEIPVSMKFAGNTSRCRACAMYGAYIRYEDSGGQSFAEVINPSEEFSLHVQAAGSVTSGSNVDSMFREEHHAAAVSATAAVSAAAASRASEFHRSMSLRKALPWRCAASQYDGQGACGLAENIWMCLVCANTGCGRYANQHAQQHALTTRHPFACELVTGRIWGYEWDTFVHADGLPYEELSFADTHGDSGVSPDLSSSALHAAPLSRSSSSANSGAAGSGLSIGEESSGQAITAGGLLPLPIPQNDCCAGSSLESRLQLRGLRSSARHTRADPMRYATRSSSSIPSLSASAVAPLGVDVQSKLHAVTQSYETLLETQLQEQRLFFEKMLAQETVRALERAYTGASLDVTESNITRAATTENHGSQQKSDDRSLPCSDSTSVAGIERFCDFEPAYGNHKVSQEIVDTFAEIERKKIEISLSEEEHRRILDSLRDVEMDLRTAKKTNDASVKHIKALRKTEEEILHRHDQLEKQFNEQEQELQQSIADLTFFLDTRSAVGRAANKEELRSGQIVMKAAPTQQPKKPSSTRSQSRGG